jgi:DNA-binding NarL/FixJ family response regulator
MLLKSSITQNTQPSNTNTPATAATRAPARSSTSTGLISFTAAAQRSAHYGHCAGREAVSAGVLAPMQADPAPDIPRLSLELRLLLNGRRLLVGTASPAYASMLRVHLKRRDLEVPPPELLGVAGSSQELLALLPDPCGDVLVATTSRLQDGPCVALLEQLLQRSEPPQLLVTLPLDDPALPLAPLLHRPRVAIVWEGNVGRGGLLRGLSALQEQGQYVDPEALERIEAARTVVGSLTEREHEVLALVVEGLTNRQIAARLVVAEVTARDHVQRILRKMEVNDRTAAAVLAVRLGLVE